MRKLFFMLLVAATTLACRALTVNNTAGGLATAIDDNTAVTSLVLRGTMDARDFLFITRSLDELTTLDLSQATIVPYAEGKALYGTVTNYQGNMIPRTAFFGKKLTSVTLPANLETIGFAAFAGCYQLQSVTIPATVSMIEDYAFAGAGLTSVELPQTVAYMGKGVFARCESLQHATVNSFTLGDFAFLGDENLTDVVIGPGVNYIMRGAFNGCKALTTIDMTAATRLSRIDEEAFINSGLENIDISSLGIGTIGDWAFAQTRLSTFNLTDGMTTLGEGALAHNPMLTTVVLPGLNIDENPSGDGVRDQDGRKKASTPRHTLERINNYTFAGDSRLNAGNLLKEDVAYIGNYAFYDVSADIDTMRLPSTLTYLGDYAMAGMTGMQTIKSAAVDVPALGENVWAGVDQPSVTLIVPDKETVALYKAADQWMYFFIKAGGSVMLGDVNNDGEVDINDVTALISFVLSGDASAINLEAANVNGDTEVDINDVTALINYVLTGSSFISINRMRAEVSERFAATADQLTMQPVALRKGETRTVDVALNNAEHDYTAMQLQVVLPQGVKLTGVSGASRGENHTFFLREHQGDMNAYDVMGISMALDLFSGNEGTVMRLTIAADEDFTAQNATITLTNVLLATVGNAYLSGDAMTHVNDGSGVEQVTAGKQVSDVRYINVAGQESETPFSGVNIVVTTYDDGSVTTTKVVQ